MRAALLWGLFGLVLIGVASGATYVWLKPIRLVDDQAELFTQDERDRLAEYHRFLLTDHDIDYRVVTAAETGDLNSFAVSRFGSLGVGRESATGRGLLLVVDPAQDLVRLEVAQALEGAFPDAFIAYVEQRQMVPFFASGRVADGILATTELIVARAQDAAANAGFDVTKARAETGGAGAAARARIGAGPVAVEPRAAAPEAIARATPEQALAAYFAAMDRRDASPDHAFYTPATRAMLRDWVVTRAQMDTIVRSYRACRAEPARLSSTGDLAVIRYPPDMRACAPWFFERDAEGWALDLTMMQRAIRFGRTNAWHFDTAASHPYHFAFTDWRFDENGFPVR